MKKELLIVIVSIFFLACIPVIRVYTQTGTIWQGIVPTFVNDEVYYYARMENIVHGYPFIGNPYFFEHRNDMSLAFFVPDWISAVPLFLGVPFVATVVTNFIIWSLVCGVLIYFFFKEYDVSGSWLSLGTILAYCMIYVLIIRPVSMQIVAPFFILFYLTYARWLKAQQPTWKDNLFLIVTIGCSFYIYTYTWQLVLITLGVTSLYFVYKKQWAQVCSMAIVSFAGVLVAIPMLVYTARQITSQYYWDSMGRIGLVSTHIPTILSFYDSAYIVSTILLWFLIGCWINQLKNSTVYSQAYRFVWLTGVSLIIALFSNVVTGKDLEISNHFERFVMIWISLVVFLLVYHVVHNRTFGYGLSYAQKIAVVCMGICSLYAYGYFFWYGFGIVSIVTTDTVTVQAYDQPLAWLRDHGDTEAVVWSNNGDMTSYIPIYTTDFVLFTRDGGLHLVPTIEMEERYLVSRYFDKLTVMDIENGYRDFGGVGNAVHQYKTYNRKVEVCTILHLKYIGVTCGQTTDMVSFKGQQYFESLYQGYVHTVVPHIQTELQKFHVKYVVKDTSIKDLFDPTKIAGAALVWKDTRFEIYKIQYTHG